MNEISDYHFGIKIDLMPDGLWNVLYMITSLVVVG